MAKQSLNALITIGAALEASVKKSTGFLRKELGSVGAEIAKIQREQRGLDKQRTVLEKQGRAVDHLDREYQGLGRTIEQLEKKQRQLNRVSEGMDRVGRTTSSAFRTIGWQAGLAAAAVGSLYGTLTAFGMKAAAGIEEINRSARMVGVTPEFFSQLAYAAGQYGVSTEALADGLKELSLRSDEFAQTGKGPAADAFKRIGLSRGDVAALSKDTAALWSVVRDRISEVDDVAARQRITDELMGGTAAEQLMDFLTLTREQYKALGEEAVKVATVTQDMADSARKFTQAQRRLSAVLTVSYRRLAVELLPKISEQFDKLSNWLIEHQPEIQEYGKKIGDAFQAVVPIVQNIVGGLATVALKVGEVVTKAAEMLGGWENLGIAVGTLFVTPSILALAKLGSALVSLGATLLLGLGPIGVVAAAVIGAAALIWYKWDDLKKNFAEFWTSIQDGAKAAFDMIATKAQQLADKIVAMLQPVKDAFNWIGDQFEALGSRSGEVAGAGRVGRFGGGTGTVEAPSAGRGVPGKAVGGSFLPGAVLVGEKGPEVRFEDRAGFIATNRQLRGMADAADRIRGVAMRGEGGGGRGGSPTIHLGGISINAAPGMSPDAIADMVMRRLQQSLRGALYDGGY